MGNRFLIGCEHDIETNIRPITTLIEMEAPKIIIDFPSDGLMEIFMGLLLEDCETRNINPKNNVELICNVHSTEE